MRRLRVGARPPGNPNGCWLIGSLRDKDTIGALATAHNCPKWMAVAMAAWIDGQLVKGKPIRVVKIKGCPHDLTLVATAADRSPFTPEGP